MEGRTYSVIQCIGWNKEIAVATGLPWEEATRERDRLEAEEIARKPNESSWTRDVFYRKLEKE